jgi:hypothetical protein
MLTTILPRSRAQNQPWRGDIGQSVLLCSITPQRNELAALICVLDAGIGLNMASMLIFSKSASAGVQPRQGTRDQRRNLLTENARMLLDDERDTAKAAVVIALSDTPRLELILF